MRNLTGPVTTVKPVKKKSAAKKILLGVLITLLIIVVGAAAAGYFLVYVPAKRIEAKAQLVMAEARGMKEEFKKNDLEAMSKKIEAISAKYKDLEKEAESVYWAGKFVPHIRDFKSGIEAGRYMITAGQESVKAIEPYSDLLGLSKTKKTNFYDKTAEERLQFAVLTLDKMLQRIDVVSKNIEEAEKRIETIDPDRYPEKVGNKEVKAKVVMLKDQFAGVKTLFVDAKPFLVQIPQILGAKEEKTYLIMFQNNGERRATGGFLTFYAVFKIQKGKITVDSSADIYEIDKNIAKHPAAPDKIKMYHKGVNTFNARDANLSPDLVESVKLFESLYEKAGNKVKYDGIIFMDSQVLVDMLTIFGDTQANGVTFSSKIDKRCDCPQVIYQMSDIVDRPKPYLVANRKGIVGELMYQLLFKALGYSPSQYYPLLMQSMFKNMDEKHMMMYFKDPEIQTAVEKLNYAGRIREYDGDYLHINNVNFAGAKSNNFIEESIVSETKINGGTIERTVRMKFKNPRPHDDCNLERGNLCLNAVMPNWIRFYVPKGSKLVELKGSKTKVLTYDELGKTVFEGFMSVQPKGQAEVIVTYTLPSTVDAKNYKLLIQNQPGSSKQELQVTVNGVKKFDDKFKTDTEIK